MPHNLKQLLEKNNKLTGANQTHFQVHYPPPTIFLRNQILFISIFRNEKIREMMQTQLHSFDRASWELKRDI